MSLQRHGKVLFKTPVQSRYTFKYSCVAREKKTSHATRTDNNASCRFRPQGAKRNTFAQEPPTDTQKHKEDAACQKKTSPWGRTKRTS